jgi:hypothetical protein
VDEAKQSNIVRYFLNILNSLLVTNIISFSLAWFDLHSSKILKKKKRPKNENTSENITTGRKEF